MRGRAFYRWFAVLSVLAIFAAACGGEGSEEPQPDVEETAEETGEETPDASPSTETPQAGEGRDVLNVVIPTDPVGLNPFPQTAGNMAVIHLAMYRMLLMVDENQEIHSDLLESWEVSDDAQTITLTVRDGLEWNDGTPMTSADVAMSLTMHLDSNISGRATRLAGVEGVEEFTAGEADSISGITTPDDSTVVIQLEAPDAAWLPNIASLTRLNPVFPAHILGDVPHEEIPEHEFFENHPVTSGPYQFVQYVPEQYVELERNPNWSDGEAGFEQVFFKIVTDAEARLAQLQSGELQFTDGVSALDVERLEALDGITVDSAQGLNPNVIGFNYDQPALEDPRVRQALVHAVDREGICEQVYRGYCSVDPHNMRLVGLEWALPDDLIEYDYDPDRARELLEEAGWDESTTLRLIFMNEAAGAAMQSAINIIQANWAAVGVDVEIVNVDVPTLLASLGGEGRDPDVHMFWNAGAVFTLDPSSVQPYNTCVNRYPDGPNLTHYCDPATDDLWAQARQVADQDERAEIYHEIFRAENANPNNLHIAVLDNIVAYDSQLQGVKVIGDIWQTYWNIGEWRWAE